MECWRNLAEESREALDEAYEKMEELRRENEELWEKVRELEKKRLPWNPLLIWPRS